MKLYTERRAAGQTLILPIVGQITLDQEAAFEVEDAKGVEFLKAIAGSTPFDTKPVVAGKKVAVKVEQEDKANAPQQTQPPKSARELLNAVVEAVGTEQVLKWLGVKGSNDLKHQTSTEKVVEQKIASTPVDVTSVPDLKTEPSTTSETQDEDNQGTEQDEPVDIAFMKEAITEADAADLEQLALMVPGVKKKDIKKLDETALRAFLLAKIAEVEAAGK